MSQEIIIIDGKRGQAPYLITMYATNMLQKKGQALINSPFILKRISFLIVF
jgi:hypothetical protein